MYKHSLSRNQRSRGFKVKQVLQICVLVTVCFWLIYQVKHSHDKKKLFEENNANTFLEANSRIEKFGGRKDIQDPIQEKPRNEKKDEDEIEEEDDNKREENVEEDDNKHEENVEEDDSKHEEEEQEEEEEKDENKRGDGDDEIDEHEQEQEKSEMEIEHEVDVLDEERDKEEVTENDDKDTQNDHDHEAREEHYKADDASSAVTHESESGSAKAVTVDLENVTVNNDTSVIEKGEFVEKEEEEYEVVASKKIENAISNSTTTVETNNQEKMSDDVAKKSVETNDTSTMNSTEAKLEISTNPSLNNTRSNSQDIETSLGESLNTSSILQTNVSEKQEISNDNLESEKEMGKSENGEGDLSHHDPIDDSDSSISLEKDVRTDLDTLPDIRIEGSNDEEAAGE